MKLLVCERRDEGKSNVWRGERRGVETMKKKRLLALNTAFFVRLLLLYACIEAALIHAL
jgi:hypothetical protein